MQHLMDTLFGFPFLIFIALGLKTVWFKYSNHIPYDKYSEQGKKNKAQLIIEFCFAVFLFFFIPLKFPFDDNPQGNLEILKVCAIYFGIGLAPSTILLLAMKYKAKKEEQIIESWKTKTVTETPKEIVEVEKVTTVTTEQKPIENKSNQ